MCAGFRAGTLNGHPLINRSSQNAVYLEAGHRSSGDTVHYTDSYLQAIPEQDSWLFLHKDSTAY